MLFLKLSDAIHAADEAVFKTLDRDTHNSLVKSQDDNPYALQNLDFFNQSQWSIQLQTKANDFCVHETYFNVIYYLEAECDQVDYVRANLIDDIVKQLADIANDDYRESTVNPAIVKLYAQNLIQEWKTVVKTSALELPNVNDQAIGNAILNLASRINQLPTDKALLVQNFIDSIEPKEDK